MISHEEGSDGRGLPPFSEPVVVERRFLKQSNKPEAGGVQLSKCQ